MTCLTPPRGTLCHFATLPEGGWSGRFAIGTFELLLLGYLAALLYLAFYSAEAFNHLDDTLDNVKRSSGSSNAPAFSNFEAGIRDRFNSFYFGAVRGCSCKHTASRFIYCLCVIHICSLRSCAYRLA